MRGCVLVGSWMPVSKCALLDTHLSGAGSLVGYSTYYIT